MSRPFHRPRGDQGQVATVVIVLVALGLLLVIARVMLPIGEAADQRTRAQTAADAAALAGAEQVRDWVPSALLMALVPNVLPDGPVTVVNDWVRADIGAGEAHQYAVRNGARITQYRYIWSEGLVEARVVFDAAAETGGRAEAVARARVGPELAPCTTSDDYTPPAPAPAPDPSDPDATPEEPQEGFELVCGELRLPVEYLGPLPSIDLSLAELREKFRPRLIG